MNNYPSYMTASLQNQLEGVYGQYKYLSVEQIQVNIIKLLKGQLAKNSPSHPFWAEVGYPTLQKAWEDELTLAEMKRGLEGPVAYVTSGHKVSPNRYHVYYRDAKSPSGVIAALGCPSIAIDKSYVCQQVEAMLEAKGLRTRLSQSFVPDYR